jgi:hypothetical protein
VQEVVLISRSVHRHFSKKDWLKLQEKLHGWRRNFEQVSRSAARCHMISLVVPLLSWNPLSLPSCLR